MHYASPPVIAALVGKLATEKGGGDVVDLSELEIPVVQEALAVALRQAVETGQAARLRVDWEVSPAGDFQFRLSLEEGAPS